MDSAHAALTDTTERIRVAAARGEPLRIRGGGTKDFYGQALNGTVLDTRAITGITSYEPSELVVTVRAGTPLAELEAALAEHGQCLPFEPPHFSPVRAELVEALAGTSTSSARTEGAGSAVGATSARAAGNACESAATVGGMVAAGLSGPARASAGGVRDFMLGVTLLNGKAELLTFGGQVMKNVAGYDVSRLMAGSMGTLGLLVDVSLKVLPVAPAEATLRFAMDQATALRQLNTWGGQPLPLNASCWVHDDSSTSGRPQKVGTLYLRLRGAVAAVEAACRTLSAQHGGERLDNATAAPDWTACRNQQLLWFTARAGRDLWRLSLPQTAPVLDLPEPPLVEWHGALRWVSVDPADTAAAARMREAAAQAGGNATLFIANNDQPMKTTARFDALEPPLDRIHRDLKKQFDPAGIFNRGRMHDHF